MVAQLLEGRKTTAFFSGICFEYLAANNFIGTNTKATVNK